MNANRIPRPAIAAVLAALALSAACTMKASSNMPPTPAAVSSAIRAADVAFSDVDGDPPRFRRQAIAVLPGLRDALNAWSSTAPSITVSQEIQGWAFEVGMLETRLNGLSERPTVEDCRPIVSAWQALRKQLP